MNRQPRTRQELIRDAVLRCAYEAFARPRDTMASWLTEGPTKGDVFQIRRHFAEFAGFDAKRGGMA